MTAPPKRRWFRFSLRTMFVVVTVAAVSLGQWNRSKVLRSLSKSHQAKAFFYAVRRVSAWSKPESEMSLAHRHELADYHWMMGQKYERAVWQPWVELLPDPEKPEDWPED